MIPRFVNNKISCHQFFFCVNSQSKCNSGICSSPYFEKEKGVALTGSMSIKKTSKKSKERFFGLVWSEPLVMGMRAEGIVIAVNVVKNG